MKIVRMLFDKFIQSEHDKRSNNAPYDKLDTRQEYVQKMRSKGYEVFVADDDELLIDIDGRRLRDLFTERFFHLKQMLWETMQVNIEKWNEFPSHTKGHSHVIIKFPFPLTTPERLFLQAWLGSDPVKEMLSMFRAWKGDMYPSLLCMNPEIFEQAQRSKDA